MINYSKQYIDNRDIAAVVKTLKSDFITQGNKIIEFEKNLNNYFGSKYCSVVSNGTMALYLLSKALGWKKNDHIICSPISFLAASNSVLFSKATPIFVDIDYETGNLSAELVEKKIHQLKKKNKKVKAIIVTDYGGLPADWKNFKKIKKKYKLKLINDNCHSIGAKYYGKKEYAIKYADYVIHSYHAVKNITTGEGGSVLTNDKKVYEKINLLRSHGVVKKNLISPWYQEMITFGFNCRITDFQCALGISQLKKLNKVLKKKKLLAKKYIEKISFIKNIEFPLINKKKEHAFHLFPVKINFKNLKIDKSKFFNLMRKKGVNLQVHYIPIYMQPYYKKNFKTNLNDLKISKKFYDNVISLPIYYSLTHNKIIKIVNLIKSILEKYSK